MQACWYQDATALPHQAETVSEVKRANPNVVAMNQRGRLAARARIGMRAAQGIVRQPRPAG
jgi:hypothetical protein